MTATNPTSEFVQPSADRQVLILDDEAIAIATGFGKAWPSSFPTLGLLSEEKVQEAAARGINSLRMRELLANNGSDFSLVEPLSSLATIVMNGRPLLGTFVATPQGDIVPLFSMTAVYESGGSWVNEVISPVGAHYLIPTTEVETRRLLINLLEEAQATTSVDSEDAYLCLINSPLDSASLPRMVRVRPGSMEVGTLTTESGFTSTDDGTLEVKDAVKFILG